MTKREKHILVLSSWLPTDKHPFLGNFVVRQAELLSQSYHVTIIDCQESKVISKISIEHSDENGVQKIIAKFPAKKNRITRKLQKKKAFEKAMKEINKVDLIIGNILLPNGWQFILAKRKFKCPLFYIEHGSYFRKEILSTWSKVDRIISKKVNGIADEIIAVSDFLKKHMLQVFPERDIKVIGNHINTDVFCPTDRSPNETTHFLHVSTLDPATKNVDGILEAGRLLKEKHIAFNLNIVSDEDYSVLQQKAISLGLDDQIHFFGPLEWEKIAPYYQKADAFVLFSKYESFSIVLAEAWATGTPVISTSVGIADQMPTEYGIQVETNNVNSLAQAMGEIVNGRTFEQESIRKHGLKFSEKVILDSWQNLIDSYG